MISSAKTRRITNELFKFEHEKVSQKLKCYLVNHDESDMQFVRFLRPCHHVIMCRMIICSYIFFFRAILARMLAPAITLLTHLLMLAEMRTPTEHFHLWGRLVYLCQ